jgi:hypothetical protein
VLSDAPPTPSKTFSDFANQPGASDERKFKLNAATRTYELELPQTPVGRTKLTLKLKQIQATHLADNNDSWKQAKRELDVAMTRDGVENVVQDARLFIDDTVRTDARRRMEAEARREYHDVPAQTQINTQPQRTHTH